jgi:hypothetical protein
VKGITFQNELLIWKQSRFYVPKGKLHTKVMQKVHDVSTARHSSEKRTRELLGKTFYWPKMKEDVKHSIYTCVKCQSIKFVATLTLGSWPRQRLTKVRAKSEPKSHISCSRECKRMWGNEPPHSQMNSHFGSGSPNGLLNFQRAITRVKTHWIKKFLISLEFFWNVDF